MSSPANPQLPGTPGPPAPNNDQRELLKFLREEAEENRKSQRDESEANRKLFLDTSKIVAIPLAVLLTLSGIFFYHDVESMKKAMEAQGEASAQAEILKMDKHIDGTLQEKFKSETIQNTIQQAAVEATRQQAPALIKEVITPEVKKAVASQSGTIKEVATRAATDEVKTAIDPVVADVKLLVYTMRPNDSRKSPLFRNRLRNCERECVRKLQVFPQWTNWESRWAEVAKLCNRIWKFA